MSREGVGIMLTVEFDYGQLAEAMRPIIREELKSLNRAKELPPLLTRKELMDLLHIGATKASELMARSDFPVLREAGVLIPTDKLFLWIDRHTEWVADNTNYFKVS